MGGIEIEQEQWLAMVLGPMKSGKSDELATDVGRLLHNKRRTLGVYKPLIDNRDGTNLIKSRDGLEASCTPISEPEKLLYLTRNQNMVIVDEIQFFEQTGETLFDPSLTDVVLQLLDMRKHVRLYGLNLNFKGEPYDVVQELMCYADSVKMLDAYCDFCGDRATRTQRLKADGSPAPYEDPLVLVGGDDKYEVRCVKHHAVPGKSNGEK